MKIALIGNQNSGKTTLFNLLTGSNQKIGNWPGVTIERKSGIIKGTDFELNDLPGIYSLSPYTSEEAVSRNYILNEKPDLIVNIVDRAKFIFNYSAYGVGLRSYSCAQYGGYAGKERYFR